MGRYDNPIPTRFLAHIDSSKIRERSYIGWRNRFKNTVSGVSTFLAFALWLASVQFSAFILLCGSVVAGVLLLLSSLLFLMCLPCKGRFCCWRPCWFSIPVVDGVLLLKSRRKQTEKEWSVTRVADLDPDSIGQWIRIRNPDPYPGGQKWPTKVENFVESSCFEVLDGLFWELKTSSVTWTFFMEA